MHRSEFESKPIVRRVLVVANTTSSIFQFFKMSFSFGFSGDDVEDDVDVGQNVTATAQSNGGESGSPFVGLPAKEHSLDELVSECCVSNTTARESQQKCKILKLLARVSFRSLRDQSPRLVPNENRGTRERTIR